MDARYNFERHDWPEPMDWETKLQTLLEEPDMTLTMAVDYLMITESDKTLDQWAYQRNLKSPQTVRENVKRAEEIVRGW